jgi:metal-dependent hydrolase (beta-lactamase superfamily II)
MFDYGLDPVGVMNNVSLPGIDIAKANAFSLSHGHYDHYMAAVELLKQNQAKIKKETPFYVGEETFCHRHSLRPGTTEAADLGQLKKEDIENLGLKVIEVKHPTEIVPGAYFTGNIARVTEYEKVHAAMGGFHLINVKTEIIQRTAADIKALEPEFVAPTHRTGFEAIVHFQREMPAEFTINTAGTRYAFAA